MIRGEAPQLPTERLGKYVLLERLSESFFGPRWAGRRAEDGDDGELIAVRCVNSRLLSDERTIDRLATAAWWAMEMDHPHALGVFDVVVDDGRLGIVTPFHEGDTLRLLLRRAHRERKPIPIPVVLRVMLDVLDAIGAVSELSSSDAGSALAYVHGGITPDSVHVGTDGTTRLLDVGVAAMASSDHSWDDDPVRAAYDAPERKRGEALDARADVFVCGILLWEMLTCEHLFSGTSAAEVTRKVRELPVPSPEGRTRSSADGVPPALASLTTRALERVPSARIPDPAALASALRELDVAPASRDEVSRFVKELGGRVSRARRLRLGTTDLPPPAQDSTAIDEPQAGSPGVTVPAPATTTAQTAPTTEPVLEATTAPAPVAPVPDVAAPAPAPPPELEAAHAVPPGPAPAALAPQPAPRLAPPPAIGAPSAAIAPPPAAAAAPHPAAGASSEPDVEVDADEHADGISEPLIDVAEAASAPSIDIAAEASAPATSEPPLELDDDAILEAESRHPAAPAPAPGAPKPPPVVEAAIAKPPAPAVPTPSPTTDASPTPAAAKPGAAKPADAKPVDAKPADAKPADAKPADAKPTDAKPADAKPADAKPVVPAPKAGTPASTTGGIGAAAAQPVAARAAVESPRSDPSPSSLTLGDLPPLPKRSMRGLALGGGIVLLAAAVILFFVARGGDEEEPAAAAPGGAAVERLAPRPAPPAAAPRPAAAEVEPVAEPSAEQAEGVTDEGEAADDEQIEDEAPETPRPAEKKPRRPRRPTTNEPTTFIPDDI